MGNNGPSGQSHVLMMLTEPDKDPEAFALGHLHSAVCNVKLSHVTSRPGRCCDCSQER